MRYKTILARRTRTAKQKIKSRNRKRRQAASGFDDFYTIGNARISPARLKFVRRQRKRFHRVPGISCQSARLSTPAWESKRGKPLLRWSNQMIQISLKCFAWFNDRVTGVEIALLIFVLRRMCSSGAGTAQQSASVPSMITAGTRWMPNALARCDTTLLCLLPSIYLTHNRLDREFFCTTMESKPCSN